MSRLVSSSVALVFNTKPWVGALAAAMLIGSSAHAASFGHSRIVSALGQPLRIDVPVTQLSAADLSSISVAPAPVAAWAQAGLTPPVDLDSLQASVVDGFGAGSKVIQVRSSQVFDKPVADLLLDVHTASGQQRFQVSLLTTADQGSQPVRVQSQGGARAGTSESGSIAIANTRQSQGTIAIKRGDTMLAIARRHAVPGVTVYQMMIALQKANPQAFIEGNVNLVKAGSMLSMPDMAALTAVSDQNARRIFQQQSQAFALYRQRVAGQASVVGQAGAAAKGIVSFGGASAVPPSATGPRDQLRLSGSAQGSAKGAGTSGGSLSADVQADDRTATSKGIKDSEARVSQLEENVQHLSQALQAQGAAASDLLVDGAKGLGLSLPESVGDANEANRSSNENPVSAAGPSSGAATGSGIAASNPAASGSVAANNNTNNATSDSANSAGDVEQSISNMAGQSVSWIQEHMLGVITGLLALIVLVIAWILRRANAARDDDDRPSPITEAMVKEKLDKINLDLEEAPSDEPAAKG